MEQAGVEELITVPQKSVLEREEKEGEKKEEEEETIEKLLTEPFHFILYYNRSKANNG